MKTCEYLGLRGIRMGSGESSTMRNFCLNRSPNIVRVIKSRRLRWARHVSKMEEGRRNFKMLTGKPTGKRPFRRPRRRWEDNIRMDLEEIGVHSGNWFDWIGIFGEPL